MSDFQVKNLAYHAQQDPRLGETLQQLQDVLNNLAKQTAAVPVGVPEPPVAPTAINVTASGGIFEVAIQDNNPANSGISPDYFLEYSLTPNFAQPTVIHLGPARNHRVSLGNQTFYWRAYSQTGRASQPSPPVYFGGLVNPTPVAGGGAITGPTPLPSTGSGTAPTNGLHGGSGYGILSVRLKSPNLSP